MLGELLIYCPGCNKRIIIKEQAKTLIRCSKCSHFVLLIRGESEDEIYDYLTQEEERFFNIYSSRYQDTYEIINFQNIYFVLVAHASFDIKYLTILTEKSKKVGAALGKYLKTGKKKDLTLSESNILYKLKAENILEIEEKKEKYLEYLKAKIECIKLLKILDY